MMSPLVRLEIKNENSTEILQVFLFDLDGIKIMGQTLLLSGIAFQFLKQ
jgi:hypothetical protein